MTGVQQQPGYVLGSSEPEIARLDSQAARLVPPTELLLRAAGIGGDLRVLDVGTGLGHVAFQAEGLLGPGGSVVGIDRAPDLLAVAAGRARERGLEARVRFELADARTFRDPEPFDAVVTRLLLFHLPDAVEVARHHLGALRPGGSFVALDFDIGRAGSEPETPLAARALGWIQAGFRSAGADPSIGARLGVILRDAGARDVTTFGVQPYLLPGDSWGPEMIAGVVRSLAPQLVAAGIATEEELGLDTLRERVAAEVADHDSVLLAPTLAGAWGRAD